MERKFGRKVGRREALKLATLVAEALQEANRPVRQT